MRGWLGAAAAAAVVAGSVVVGMPRASLAATSPACAVPSDFRILDDRVTESSGLAVSRRHPGVVWTANDSGDSGRIFAVDTRTGRTVGVHRFGAPVRDVEALAITPSGRVLVGDIGDNGRSRAVVRIFWFDEPDLGDTQGDWASWELTYPDGPHDAEALAVDPRTGRIVVVTKDSVGGVYEVPAEVSRTGVNRLRKVGAAPAVVTDAAYLPDGSGLVTRTYTSALLLDPKTFAVKASRLLPLMPQGETLVAWPCGDRLLVGTEGARSDVRVVPVPEVTTPSTPSTTAGPVSSGVPSSASDSAAGSGDDSRAWWLVGGVAGAVLAGVVWFSASRGRRRG
ncbi:WD40 repeat domain-containing protein [Knoellia koreensis]|uniref:WD40 repeat domain-containing protein n=1 Tax=Knoellia koreensis TaxID=2730921 RepID=A0A849HEP5_9MICO|nr:WD40 repeat domain-containing protein [Knoellia sp. DB2414S]NNM45599.1 WD40 repeat domain-containing protein [Knoellia sp. DB2414S]